MGILLTATGAAAEGATGIAAIIPLIAWFVIIIGFMYFFMIRPQKKEQKREPIEPIAPELGYWLAYPPSFYSINYASSPLLEYAYPPINETIVKNITNGAISFIRNDA